MSFRRGGAGKRRDETEPAIRAALEACGRRSWQVSGLGLPDLLIWSPGAFVSHYEGFWMPVEVKTAKGGFTEHQDPLRWPVLRSVEDALALIGVKQ